MTTDQDARSHRVTHLIDSGVSVLVVLSVPTVLTIRYGWAIWSTVLQRGWPVIAVSTLVGILSGIVRWGWLQNSRSGRRVLSVLNLGVIIPCAMIFMRRLATADQWLGLFVAVLQLGLMWLTEAALKKAHKIESRA